MNRELYGFTYSSCTHRVRLMLSLLGLAYENRPVHLGKGEHRTPEFLALNPVGQVPVLVEGDRKIFDSHAILLYLAETHGRDRWWQADAYERAQVGQWLFFDANEMHNGIGFARNHLTFGVPGDAAAASARARAAMQVLQGRLASRDWLELGKPTLADVACAPLVAVHAEAGLQLSDYPHVQAWLARMQSMPGYVGIPAFARDGQGGAR